MDSQLGLFDSPYTRPRARASDPTSSHAAADRAERIGIVRGHAELIVRWAVELPGRNARELSSLKGGRLTTVQIDRRTSELERDGWITRGNRFASEELRIYPTEKARQFAASGRTDGE